MHGQLPSHPRKQGQSQLYDRRVQGEQVRLEPEFGWRVRIEPLRSVHEDPGNSRKATPIAMIIGVRKVGSRNPAAEAHEVGQGWPRPQTCLDTPQIFPISELRENHRCEMVVWTKRSRRPRHRQLIHRSRQLRRIETTHALREHCRGVMQIRSRTERFGPSQFKSKTRMSSRYSLPVDVMRISQQAITGQPCKGPIANKISTVVFRIESAVRQRPQPSQTRLERVAGSKIKPLSLCEMKSDRSHVAPEYGLKLGVKIAPGAPNCLMDFPVDCIRGVSVDLDLRAGGAQHFSNRITGNRPEQPRLQCRWVPASEMAINLTPRSELGGQITNWDIGAQNVPDARNPAPIVLRGANTADVTEPICEERVSLFIIVTALAEVKAAPAALASV